MARKPKSDWSIDNLSITDKTSLLERIKECHKDLQEIESAKENLKDSYEVVKEELGIPKRTWNFLLKASFFNNGDETLKKNEELAETWESFKLLQESKRV
jgi:hypothetical protein